ncbi:hypothetical protein CF326_g10119, partial [Tilletia indica]
MRTMRLFGKGALALVAASTFLPNAANALQVSITQLTCSFCVYTVTLTPGEITEGAAINFRLAGTSTGGEAKTVQVPFSSAGISPEQTSNSINTTWSTPFTSGGPAEAAYSVIDSSGN